MQKVIPMLPKVLSECLCSLNPHTDRLAFSVIWKIRPSGEIVDEWIGRTIINSVAKLSYEDAQRFIYKFNMDHFFKFKLYLLYLKVYRISK